MYLQTFNSDMSLTHTQVDFENSLDLDLGFAERALHCLMAI
jgi:hypothetical protein